MPAESWPCGATTTTTSGRIPHWAIGVQQKRAGRLSNLRAPRPARLPNPKPTTINPKDSRYERGTNGGQVSRLEHHAERDDFIMDGIARRRLPGLRLLAVVALLGGAFRRRHAVDAIFLRRARVDFSDQLVFEEGQQMQPDAVFMAAHPFGAAAALGDGFIFLFEGFGGFCEALAALELAVAVLGTELEIPVLGHVLGAREAALLGAPAPFLALEIRVAVPGSAVCAAVEMDLVP